MEWVDGAGCEQTRFDCSAVVPVQRVETQLCSSETLVCSGTKRSVTAGLRLRASSVRSRSQQQRGTGQAWAGKVGHSPKQKWFSEVEAGINFLWLTVEALSLRYSVFSGLWTTVLMVSSVL